MTRDEERRYREAGRETGEAAWEALKESNRGVSTKAAAAKGASYGFAAFGVVLMAVTAPVSGPAILGGAALFSGLGALFGAASADEKNKR